MHLLVLGGTRFLGRHLADLALQRGHRVTLLHRGRSGSGLFPQAEHLIADRNADLSVLDGRRFDAVVDTSAYWPRQVREVAARLAGRVGHYQMVSTISVYADPDAGALTEDATLATLADPATETVSGETYGGLKVLCEQAAVDGFGAGRTLLPRPGLLVGPHDPTERFTWWVRRLLRAAPGSEVLAPGDPAGPVQFIDARDAAAWMLAQAESGRSGPFNLTGPATPLSMEAFLATARRVLAPADPPPRLCWVAEDFLLEQGVASWTELPLWLPRRSDGIHRTEIARALATGLQCRALEATLQDTAAWARAAPLSRAGEGPPRPPTGLAPEREAALLQAWHTTPRG
ncbi:MAG: NAD-dependent epimerase/dehydratase family protein [Rubrivivax sp.]|nr:NAD-dependent epimerase/dehydratase family protein [Rubrivivax sp.]